MCGGTWPPALNLPGTEAFYLDNADDLIDAPPCRYLKNRARKIRKAITLGKDTAINFHRGISAN